MLSGLRGRFVAAMLLVSAVTLTLTGVALVSPLQNRLRNDEIDGLTRAVRAEQPAFARLTARDLLTSNSSQLRALARTLHRATGADISVFTESGRRVFATDRDPGVTSPEAAAALRTGRVSRTRTGPRGEARVGVPLLVDGERIAVELRKPLPNLAGAVRVVRNAFLLAAAISLLVALLIGVLLARQLVGRLRALRDTALRVAEIGPVAEMQSDMTRDEVGDLTRAFVTMQQHLREQA